MKLVRVGSYLSADMKSVNSATPADWAMNLRGKFNSKPIPKESVRGTILLIAERIRGS